MALLTKLKPIWKLKHHFQNSCPTLILWSKGILIPQWLSYFEHQKINTRKIKTRGMVVHLIFGVRDANGVHSFECSSMHLTFSLVSVNF